MPEQERLSQAELETEQALAKLRPAALSIGMANVLAEAVRRSETARRRSHRQLLLWRGVALSTAAALAVVVWLRRPVAAQPERVVVRIVHDSTAEATPPPPAAMPISETPLPQDACSYLVLRERVFAGGMEALPPPPVNSQEHNTVRIDGRIMNKGS